MRRSTLVTLLVVVTSTACASAGRGSRGSTCALSRADSVYLAGQPLYRDCSVNVRAELLNPDRTPDFQPSGDRSCYSATVQFVVDSTGWAHIVGSLVLAGLVRVDTSRRHLR